MKRQNNTMQHKSKHRLYIKKKKIFKQFQNQNKFSTVLI